MLSCKRGQVGLDVIKNPSEIISLDSLILLYFQLRVACSIPSRSSTQLLQSGEFSSQ